MHAEMIIIFFLTIIVAQFVLIEWKRRHYRSYSVRAIKQTRSDSFEDVVVVDNSARNVADSFNNLFETSVVEVYFYVAVVFLHHWFDSQKSDAKAY